MNLVLHEPCLELADSFIRMRDASVAVGEDSWSGRHALAHTDVQGWIAALRRRAAGEEIPEEWIPWVPETQYWILRDGEVVGDLELRHPLNKHLWQVGGHVGYSTHPDYRRQGIATFALREGLRILGTWGLLEVLATCRDDNVASIRTIENAGGRRIEDAEYGGPKRRRYLIPTPLHHFTFRPLSSADFPFLQRWLSEPHVNAWWHQALDLAAVASKYLPRIDGTEPTHVYIINSANDPIGFIQWYRWSDYSEHALQLGADSHSAGVDLAIGECALIGRGYGPEIIRQFVEAHVLPQPDVTSVVVDVDARNARSLRAFEKAGFSRTISIRLKSEEFERQVLRLEPTFAGQ